MAKFRCPGCKKRFDNSRALGTHRRYCATKITAVATKLLEQCKLNSEKRRVDPKAVEEEPETEDNEVPAADTPCPMPVSRDISTLLVFFLSMSLRLSWCG